MTLQGHLEIIRSFLHASREIDPKAYTLLTLTQISCHTREFRKRCRLQIVQVQLAPCTVELYLLPHCSLADVERVRP